MAAPGGYGGHMANGINGYAPNGLTPGPGMVPTGVQSLRSIEYQQLFDIVDNVRKYNFRHELLDNLPQVVVWQSGGRKKFSSRGHRAGAVP